MPSCGRAGYPINNTSCTNCCNLMSSISTVVTLYIGTAKQWNICPLARAGMCCKHWLLRAITGIYTSIKDSFPSLVAAIVLWPGGTCCKPWLLSGIYTSIKDTCPSLVAAIVLWPGGMCCKPWLLSGIYTSIKDGCPSLVAIYCPLCSQEYNGSYPALLGACRNCEKCLQLM